MALESTMMDFPLTLQMVFAHGRKVHGTTGEVATWTATSPSGAWVTQLARVASELETVEHVIVTGAGSAAGLDVRGATGGHRTLSAPHRRRLLHRLRHRQGQRRPRQRRDAAVRPHEVGLSPAQTGNRRPDGDPEVGLRQEITRVLERRPLPDDERNVVEPLDRLPEW
jgi:hypothetical protein